MSGDRIDLIDLAGQGPQLFYRCSDGKTFITIDVSPVGYRDEDTDTVLREKRICRALLQHALDLLNGEDTFS